MRRGTRASACAIVMLLAACSRPVARPVEIRGMQFEPQRLDARVGDTIVFHNGDIVPHTATASKELDTGELKRGESGRWVVQKAGTIEYVCSYHPTMRATIVTR